MVSGDRLTRLAETVDRIRHPEDWVALQYNLALCSWTIGDAYERHDKVLAERLRTQGFGLVRAVLTKQTYERDPFRWARMHMAIAIYQRNRENIDLAALEDAIVSARAAVEILVFEKSAGERWFAQMALGDLLHQRWKMLRKVEDIRAAVIAYSDAARSFYRKNMTGGWAVAQLGRATALLELGAHERDACLIMEAGYAAKELTGYKPPTVASDIPEKSSLLLRYAALGVQMTGKKPAELRCPCASALPDASS